MTSYVIITLKSGKRLTIVWAPDAPVSIIDSEDSAYVSEDGQVFFER